MKHLLYIAFSLTGFSLLFSSCKSNETEKQAQLKQDSITAAATKKPKTINGTGEFAITPPDADYTGDYVDKYPNGVIKFTGNFRFGERHGHWMAFYDNGIKWSECFYDKGKKHGETIVYFPNGNVQYKGWYKNDLRDSLWIYYDQTGKELDKHAFRNDEETGLVN
jgi:antitoxin component YwqK of YwqJK toxin-antitoxin module